MPLSKDQKWTVGTGIAVVLAVLVIVIIFQPHMPAVPGASAVNTPVVNATPPASPAPAASPMTAEPTLSATPLIISTPAPAGQ
jgi:Na+-transporting methylmalonyl-CoA/oxaloacetate decarboxylase gamma subunit